MSLCVAWKYQDSSTSKVCFAADSCATDQRPDGEREMPFGGVKLLELPVRVVGPTDSSNGRSAVVFEGVYGIAFVDSFFLAFLLREMLAGVLADVQFIGAPADLNIERICKVVRHYHEHFSREVDKHHGQDSDLEFFLGGFCPATNRIRFFRFSMIGEPASRASQFEEVLTGAGFSSACIGLPNATHRFNELMALNLSAPPCRCHYTVLRRLRDVIEDPSIRFVGGAIQYGEFDEQGNFRVIGSMALEVNEGRLTSKWYLRGTETESVYTSTDIRDLHHCGSYISPFREDVAAFRCQTARSDDGTCIPVDELITVVPCSPAWQQLFEAEREFIAMLGIPIAGIEHFGSTAVEGLPAQPVVDMLVGVQELSTFSGTTFRAFRALSYDFLGEVGMPGRLCYRKRPTLHHRHRANINLHVVPIGSLHWERGVALRDYLRNHPVEARAYAEHKLRCLNQGAWTLLHYSERKARYMSELADRAVAWKRLQSP